MAASVADLDAALQQEGTDIDGLKTSVDTIITKIGSNPDLTTEVNQLKAFSSALQTLKSSIDTADGTSGTPAPTV